ncbi:hypothetical protein K8I31_05440, partial [bacterium]|nr:hypothetical protein [bacterium]
PVLVSPSSLQAALSTIHGENVEIVPDARLLSRGIVVFAGQTIGIGMYEHPKMQVLVDETGAVAEPDQSSEETADLMNRIQLLEERLSALESAPPAVVEPEPEPVVEEIVEPEPEPEPAPEPEPEPEAEENLSEETISLDDIESEELSPVTEDINEDELMAAIALQDDDDEEEEDGLDLDMGEIEEAAKEEAEDGSSSDALDLGEIEGLLGEETEEAEEEPEAVEEEEPELAGEPGEEELNLDELDLGSIGLEVDEDDEIAEAEDETETAEADDSEDENALDLGELDLESLDEDSLGDDALGELDLGEGEEESLEFDESDLGDLDIDMGDEGDEDDDSIGDALDLDVLGELDSGDEGAFTPHKVFNGEKILLLGGKAENNDDYQRIVQELGGSAEWHGELNGMGAEEISELVNQCDLILTLTSDALSDPGILQAVNYAQENNKRLFEHHSANPVSVQKQLVKLVEDGKV